MKKIFLIISGLLITLQCFAQDCTTYLYLQKDKTIEMTGFNKKGDVTMKSVSKVSDVKTANGATSANVAVETFDKNGKSLGTSTMEYQCNGGTITMQMHIEAGQTSKQPMAMNFSMTGTGSGGFPPNMKVGDHLPDYTTQMNMGGMNMTMKVTDRIVAAKESVTTPAGTWDCFKISYKTTRANSMGGGADSTSAAASPLSKLGIKLPSSTSESTIWFASNVGMVKSESKYGSMELTAIR